jgi:hypothetical protein
VSFRTLATVFSISVLVGSTALASETLATNASSSSTDDLNSPRFESPVGLGGLVGQAPGSHEYAFVVEGQNHFTQREGMYGLNQYGQGESRLELGNGVGISLQATSGVSLYGLKETDHHGVAPHLGIEPFSGMIHWNSGGRRTNVYEWLPMASVGPQFAFGSCRLLPLIRGGGAAGNITQSGYTPSIGVAYGAGTYLNCETIDVAAEATQIQSQNRTSGVRVADLSYRFLQTGLKLGLRGESELANEIGRPEQRVLVILRSHLGE